MTPIDNNDVKKAYYKILDDLFSKTEDNCVKLEKLKNPVKEEQIIDKVELKN